MDIRDGKVTSYQVNMMVTFVLDNLRTVRAPGRNRLSPRSTGPAV